jgi:multidrug efflux pump subunit AcrB
VQVRKATPNILLAVHLYSPDPSRDLLYLSNYATLHIKDALARLPGVGDVQLFGARDYAMRIWLDPDKAAAYRLNASEVLAAPRAQNVQVSAGLLNQPPVPGNGAFQINVQTLGRLATPEQFDGIVIKTDDRGRVTGIRDIGWVEVGAADSGSTAYMDRGEGLPLLIFAQPGANSLAVEHEVLSTMAELKKDFHTGVDSIVIYNPTIFVAKSVREVATTIFVAILLVVGVVILFPQTWRASIIPVVAIPISLIGTFVVLYAFGISLNNLSLFGLMLAVGIVVDDATSSSKTWNETSARVCRLSTRRDAPHDGGGWRRPDFHRSDVVRRIRTLGVSLRHHRAVFPPVRRDHRGFDGDPLLRFADTQPSPVRIVA